MAVARSIVCVECGGECNLMTPLSDDDPAEAGDVVVYGCRDCAGRFDVVVDEDDVEPV